MAPACTRPRSARPPETRADAPIFVCRGWVRIVCMRTLSLARGRRRLRQLRRASLTSSTMRLAVRVLSFALLPAVAGAQGASPYSAAQQGSAAVDAAHDTTPAEGDRVGQARVLVVDCPARGSTGAAGAQERSDADTTTLALVAVLC